MKALAEEKYHHFKEMYGELGIKTIISTHDRKEYDRDLERKEFDIAVVVFEKLNALLVSNPNLLQGIGLIVIDELQMMGDDTRGAGLELLLTKILLIALQATASWSFRGTRRRRRSRALAQGRASGRDRQAC